MNNKQEELRYERKFLIENHSEKEVEQMIKFHPACFSEIYHERVINNIYFDTLGFNNYYDNVEGEKERLKVRIRWYGEQYGKIESPILEMKIKKGLLGYKESYPLGSFIFDKNFSQKTIIDSMTSVKLPVHIKHRMDSLKPTLLNRYIRKYFISANKNFRITIDKDLTYFGINYGSNTLLNKSVDNKTTILELKYNEGLETEAKQIGSMLPFVLTKSSKYLQGLERTVF
jgi:SPX domain protein involved in polyphosphate accumulation